jgi:hypothetical protein
MKFTSKMKKVSLTGAIVLNIAFVGLQVGVVAKEVNSAALQSSLSTILSSGEPAEVNQAVGSLEVNWQPQNIPQILETVAYTRNSFGAQKLISLLQEKTGQSFGSDMNLWYFWLWNQPETIFADYSNFKANTYRNIDPKFDRYFRDRQASARIRLDEIRWGGVVQDGSPPLRNPKMLPAKQADYLQDSNVVFGIEINGDARAYPKRILAWHEMFVDTIGGVDIAGVYCTLCGTVIPYKTTFKGKKYNLGTSGFLYRSNKLMYDQATQSLWNTIKGEPVLGPLVDKGIALEHLSVVTTTWGEWKRRHPTTTVLSADTGHRRDYGEGAAYGQYFATHELMFNTPFADKRLQNKQEVLALRFPASPKQQLAIDTAFLNKNPLYKNNVGRQKLLILTDRSGANRVYDPKEVEFVSYDRDSTVTDNQGGRWVLSEGDLTAENDGRRLNALPYHRAFWFGWHATYPETRLIK